MLSQYQKKIDNLLSILKIEDTECYLTEESPSLGEPFFTRNPNRIVSFEDFYMSTFANFKSLSNRKIPKRPPDYRSSSGSEYWYEGDAVYRYSTHFFRSVASCRWFLDGYGYKKVPGGLGRLGYCKLSDFMPIIILEVGKTYKVFYAPRDRKGVETLMTFEGKLLKRTMDYYIFDNKRIGTLSYCTAKIIDE